ncbi:winged helix-turn-helix transcriptional regulator [Brachybacterium sp. FME24]|uniref:winged helix-turn-helix transcriptional regulator n=1 Tax=Brachybacterium sp. FME24 TaxID=2742605 RepID=UPI0018674308|nr:winged helix-turn-helix transcriptional regulator [Brachybacterium sp. FME24]
MKSYGQLCAVARALDVVGDRWTLLIVRELLLSPERRFSQLQRGLPGIAPNLLSARLRTLDEHGILERASADGPASTWPYRLTQRGRALEAVVRELLRWGAPTVPNAPADAHFQMHWLALPARHLLRDRDPDLPEATVRFGDLDDGFDATSRHGVIAVDPPSPDRDPVAVIHGPGQILVGLLQGALPLERAVAAGASVDGDTDALRRLLPAPPPPG